jgi:hypothetical protein
VAVLPQHKREDHQELKLVLLATCSTARAAFWTYERQKSRLPTNGEETRQRFALKKKMPEKLLALALALAVAAEYSTKSSS